MENWIFLISIIASLICGLKLKSKCCGKECSISVEREERDDEVLRSVKIGKRSKVNKSNNEITETNDNNEIINEENKI